MKTRMSETQAVMIDADRLPFGLHLTPVDIARRSLLCAGVAAPCVRGKSRTDSTVRSRWPSGSGSGEEGTVGIL
jgi:hypothetical protein